ncbi:MAG TPA: metallophosphoesterase [Kofleriaceae bacterium]
MAVTSRTALLLASGALAACSGSAGPQPYEVSAPRDWTAHPAILDLPAASTLYAISDVHGGYDRLAALLAAANLTTGVPATPSAIAWSAGDATLIVAGDLFDKGPNGVEVIDALVVLQASASIHGGRVVVTLGNHEAEFLADPTNSKADASDGLDAELHSDAIDPMTIASGRDPRGVWLRDLPFGVRIGRWFFAHAANTAHRDLATLEAALEADVTRNDYRGAEVVGADSILESRDWFTDSSAVTETAAALAVDHVVFGHSPHALGADGEIAVANGAALFRIDCGMSPGVDYSKGEVLRVQGQQVDAMSASGSVRHLWP